MLGYLQGEILEHSDGKILVGIGDRKSGGLVGYSVTVPQNPSHAHFQTGQTVELFIYTHVREEAFDLYGFCSKFEKSLFLILLSVNGVGPKSALGILSAAPAADLVNAIIRGDQAFLTRLPGIGKKTAERVIVDLRDGLKKKLESGQLAGLPSRAAGDGIPTIISGKVSGHFAGDSAEGMMRDAKAALVGLGYKESDAEQLLGRVIANSDAPPKKVEDLVRTALRQLS